MSEATVGVLRIAGFIAFYFRYTALNGAPKEKGASR